MALESATIELEHLPVVAKLTKDVKITSIRMTPREVRTIVDSFYQQQENRKRYANQKRACDSLGESSEAVKWLTKQGMATERAMFIMLKQYAGSHYMGRWAQQYWGIGPIIAAGLMAHIDIEKTPTVGHIWNFAGLNPTARWEKGQPRPWNARLKVLAYHIGQCIKRIPESKGSYYGRVYRERKALEVARNEAGELAGQAAEKLERFDIGKTTDAYAAYSTGKLPPAHLDMRAARWTTKLFLSHWHGAAFERRYGIKPPEPYAIAHLGHAHLLTAPPPEKAWDLEEVND